MEQLNHLYTWAGWPLAARVLRLVLFLLLLMAVWLAWRAPCAPPNTRKTNAPPWTSRFFLAALVGVFVLLLVHQAGWQLAGQSRPEFVAFMQLHDRRAFNPAHHIQRGRILDRKGIVLAETRSDGGKLQRAYPQGPVCAHVVGYAHPLYGSYGMEQAGNATLMGATFSSLEEWQALGRGLLNNRQELKGKDLKLTLDARLQRLAYDRLGARRGGVVLLDIQKGDVLVAVSKPSFDPARIDADLFSGRRGDSVLLNRATHGLYPPGSTFKVVTAAAALEQGFSGTIFCPADGWTTSAANPRIRDYGYYAAREKGTDWAGYGALDLATALAKSSNVFFARLGVETGQDALQDTAARFLFNGRIPLQERFGMRLDAPGGRLPRLAERDQYGLAQVSMGQGRVLATPLQMGLIAAAVGGRGVAPRPRLGLDASVQDLGRFMSEETADRLAAMMRGVVTDGTARGLNVPGLQASGKTGTAENPGGASHSWFIGFAPFEHPRLAVSVLIEHGGFGSTAALPLARELLTAAQAAGYLGVDP